MTLLETISSPQSQFDQSQHFDALHDLSLTSNAHFDLMSKFFSLSSFFYTLFISYFHTSNRVLPATYLSKRLL